MKIDIAEVPNIRNTLDKLMLDQHNLNSAEDTEDDVLRITAETGVHLGDISKDELVAVFKARIDAGVKYLAQRYQIDFMKSNVNAPAPMQPQPPSPDEVAS